MCVFWLVDLYILQLGLVNSLLLKPFFPWLVQWHYIVFICRFYDNDLLFWQRFFFFFKCGWWPDLPFKKAILVCLPMCVFFFLTVNFIQKTSRSQLTVSTIAGSWLLYCQEALSFGVTTVERNPVGDFWNLSFIECCTFSLWNYNIEDMGIFSRRSRSCLFFLTEPMRQILFVILKVTD